MLSLFAAAAAMLEPAPGSPQVRPARQASASVVIVRAEVIRFGEPAPTGQASIVRQSAVREPDGSRRPSSLVEFY